MNCVSSGVCHRLSCTATSGFPLYEQLLKAPSWPNRDKAESCVVAEATNRRSFCGVSGLWVLGYLDVSSSCLLQQRNRRLIAKNIGNSAGITLLSSAEEARYVVSSYPAEISPGKTIICGLIEDRSVSVIPVYPGPPAGFGFPACEQNVRFFFITCHQLSLYCWLIAQVYVKVPQFKLIVIAVVQSCDKVSVQWHLRVHEFTWVSTSCHLTSFDIIAECRDGKSDTDDICVACLCVTEGEISVGH